jgi:transposase
MKTVCKWFERFRKGCKSVEDEERSGRPSTTNTQKNVERVSEMIRTKWRLKIREISEDLNISYGSVQKHINNRFEHETSECEICSTCFDGRTKVTAFANFV